MQLKAQFSKLPPAPETQTLLQRAAGFAFRQDAFAELRQKLDLPASTPDHEIQRAAAELLVARTGEWLAEQGKAVPPPPSSAEARAPGLSPLAAARGLAPDDGRGPEPDLRRPSERAVRTARTRLAVLRPGRKMSSEDVRTLLESTAWTTRQGLASASWASGSENMFSAERVQGACGLGQGLSVFHLEDLGLSSDRIHVHQAADVFEPNSFRHAFVVADMPDGKSYLIDTTFRQFFQPERSAQDQVGEPGRLMRATRAGRKASDTLLRQGFIELDDEVATLYGAALSANPEARFAAADLRRSTMEVDFDRAELQPILAAPPPLEATPGPRPRLDSGGPGNRGPP